MTQAHERTATLSALVAEEIRALMARKRMSGRQLATQLAVSPSWVSYRLTGTQAIDLDDLALIANALSVSVLDLMPPQAASRGAGGRSGTPTQTIVRVDSSDHPMADQPITPRPTGRTAHHVAAGASPIGGGRKDAARPVSAIPASRRRPARMGPGNRPMSL